MTTCCEIRQAVRADLACILQLYAQPALDDGEVLSEDAAITLFERIEQYPDYHLYVAVAVGRIVGTFALLIIDNLGHLGAPSGLMEDVAVAPHMQGQGIGRAMVAYAADLCREKGCYKMALSANLKRERAHAFYESVGLKRHGYSFCVDLLADDGEA
jgi:GNAT superfamily N-acetyltransferase